MSAKKILQKLTSCFLVYIYEKFIENTKNKLFGKTKVRSERVKLNFFEISMTYNFNKYNKSIIKIIMVSDLRWILGSLKI